MEVKIGTPIVFKTCSRNEIDSLLSYEDELSREVEEQKNTIESVLSLCSSLLSDSEGYEAHGDMDSINVASDNLNRQWSDICMQSKSRRDFISSTWDSWVAFFEKETSLDRWLSEMEGKVGELSSDSTVIPYAQLTPVSENAHDLQTQIHRKSRKYEELNQHFRTLSRFCGIHLNRLDTQNEIKSKVKSINDRYHRLNNYLAAIMKRIKYSSDLYDEFSQKKAKSCKLLQTWNDRLLVIENDSTKDEAFKRKSIVSILKDIKKRIFIISEFNTMKENVFQRSSYPDCSEIEVGLSNYIEVSLMIYRTLIRISTVYQIEIHEIITIISYIIPKEMLDEVQSMVESPKELVISEIDDNLSLDASSEILPETNIKSLKYSEVLKTSHESIIQAQLVSSSTEILAQASHTEEYAGPVQPSPDSKLETQLLISETDAGSSDHMTLQQHTATSSFSQTTQSKIHQKEISLSTEGQEIHLNIDTLTQLGETARDGGRGAAAVPEVGGGPRLPHP